MIVHLTVPTHTVQEKMLLYERMIAAIHAQGDELARDWIRPTFYNSDVKDKEHRADIVRQVHNAIERADVVIADVSDRGTAGAGLQIAWALQQGKPVLALHNPLTPEGILVAGIDNPLYTFMSTKDYEAAIVQFLTDVRKGK